MNALIGNDVVISKMRGKWIQKQFGNCKTSVIITFHPAFLMRQPAQKKMSWIDLKMIRDRKTNLKIWLKELITAGVDEVGRGCLAGPVVSAAVVLKKGINLKLLKDSKKISFKKRKIISDHIKNNSYFAIF